jgi:hypothetical protein
MNMKWLRYQRVIIISLKTQVGITTQKNKWTNTDPRTYPRTIWFCLLWFHLLIYGAHDFYKT